MNSRFAWGAAALLGLFVALWLIAGPRPPAPVNDDSPREPPVAALESPYRTVEVERAEPIRIHQRRAESQPLALTGTPRRTLSVRATTPEGSPVAGAVVTVSQAGDVRTLDPSDETGRTTLALTDLAPLRLRAHTSTLASPTLDVEPARQAEVELVLTPAALISGDVRWAWGANVGAGVTVQALESGHAFDPDVPGLAHAEFGRIHTAQTDADGRFAVHGLDPRRTYTLSATGPGLITPRALLGVAPGTEGLSIPVGRVFAAVVELREPGGGPLRVNPSLRHIGTAIPSHAGRRLGTSRHDTGPLDLGALRELPGDDLLLMYVATQDVETFGPVEVAIAAPGYEAVKATFDVPPLDTDVTTLRITLTPRFDRVGSLHVLFFGGPPPAGPEQSGLMAAAPAWIVLDDLGGSAGPVIDWRIPLTTWPAQGEVIEIPGVPAGSYRLTVEAEHQLFGYPSRAADGPPPVLVPGEQLVTLDCPLLGSALLDLTRADGTGYSDAAVVSMRSHEQLDTGSVAFNRAPYLVEGLPPGTYTLRVMAPFPGGSTTTPVEITVSASNTTRQHVALPPLDR